MIEINNKKLCESCFAETEEEKCPHCGYSKEEYTADPMVLPLGTKLMDKILIGKVMGKGGFGITYLGYDLRMEKIIAVKEYYPNGIAYRSQSGTEVLVADSKSNETFDKGTEKFYSEAEMVAQFNGNPNIVGVYDYFRANNTVYLIMEYLNGVTLKNYVKKHGKITDGQALFVMDKIAAALSITHSAGVLHRDISPDNIMVCLDGKIKLIDFGAARQIMAESSSNLTVVMKPGYTPIEQYTKKGRQGAWTDIYALGASIYFAMTETVIDDPYERMDNDGEFAENRHGINTTLWNVIKKCTMINASDRFGSAIELRKALSGVSSPVKPEPLPLDKEDMKTTEEEAAKEAAEASAGPVESTTEPIEVFSEGGEESSEEPIVQTEGYDPDVNVYAKTEGKKLLFGAIGAAAAIAVIVVGIVLFVNRPESELPVDADVDGTGTTTTSGTSTTAGGTANQLSPTSFTFSDTYSGDWSLGAKIPKNALQDVRGDVKVTLYVEGGAFGKKTGEDVSPCIKLIDFSDHGEWLDGSYLVSDDDLVLSHDYGSNDDHKYAVKKGESAFAFTITSDSIAKLSDEGLGFQVNGVIIKSAMLTPSRTVELNNEFPGSWERSLGIHKDSLMMFKRDIKVTLQLEYVEVEKEYADWAGGDVYHHHLQITDSSDRDIKIKAYNMTYDEYGSSFYLGGTKKSTGSHKFEFILTQDSVNEIVEYIYFRSNNLYVSSVTFEDYDPMEDIVGENAVLIDMQDDGSFIPKSRLEGLGGDVKVTLSIHGEFLEGNGSIIIVPNDEYGSFISVFSRNLETGANNRVYSVGYYETAPDVFTFVISAEQISRLGELGLHFYITNAHITSAALEPA